MEKKKNKKKSADTKSTVKEKKVKAVKEVIEEVTSKETSKKEAKTEKKSYTLFKVLAICLLVAFVLTWIIPTGTFKTVDSVYKYSTTDPIRLGIHQIFLAILYASNYYLVQIVYVLIVGVFYGVISKTNGYKALVEKIAKIFSTRKKLFVLISSLIIALITSMATDCLVAVVLIPFIISIASRLGFGKLRSVAIPVASMAIGLVGQTLSTNCLYYLKSYMSIDLTANLGIRFGILAIGYILFNALFILNMKKNKADSTETIDFIELTGDAPAKKVWPYAIMFVVILVLMVLGFISWSSYGIEVFDNFHTWITETLAITINGESTPILGYLLGTSDALYGANISENPAFGNWDLYTFGYVLLLIALLVKLITKMKFSEALEGALNGLRKMAGPAIMLVFAYTMFVISYESGITGYIVDKISGNTFNPFSATLANIIANFMHVDFGYSGFYLGSLYLNRFADYTNLIAVIMTSTNGLVSLVAPTSVVLATGLSMYNVSYKKWLQYIWKFAVIMLVILLIIFTLMAYI